MCNCNQAERSFDVVCQILKKYNNDKTKLIPILQEIQKEYRYLPQTVLNFVSNAIGSSPAEVFGVATFYGHFALKPKGKYVIKICNGTACHVKGSLKILSALQKRLKVTEEENTSTDMLFTVETVSCLGACGLAPAVVINEDVHGQVSPDQAVMLVEEIIKKERGQ